MRPTGEAAKQNESVVAREGFVQRCEIANGKEVPLRGDRYAGGSEDFRGSDGCTFGSRSAPAILELWNGGSSTDRFMKLTIYFLLIV
jgi:hypothetical protein